MIRIAFWTTWIVLAAASLGCGDSNTISPDEEMVMSLVLDVSDALGDSWRMGQVFAPGTVIDQKQFAGLSFGPVRRPEIAGETATILVRVKDRNDEKIGETTWTAVKDGEAWKIATAPLP